MSNHVFETKFWAGTEGSFAAYLQAMEASTALQARASLDDDDEGEDDEQEVPRLLTKQGDVGVISIAGPLVPGDKWYNRYIGVTGYGEIRAALVHAAKDPSIGAILLDVNSGGGAVSGVTDVVDLIKTVDAQVKPVHSFSDGMVASAAYWIASSARTIHIGKVTEAGSVGVLTVHKEISKAMADSGIKATVLRAGEFKALGNPYEPLSDKAEAEIKGQLDQMYRLFVSTVAENRGVSYEVADTTMAQGRVFIGDSALTVRLVDGVSNFDNVVSNIQGAIDAVKSHSQYGGNFQKGTTLKTALTQQQLAAMAEGAGFAVTETAPVVDAPVVDAPVVAADVNPDDDVAAGASNDNATAQASDKPNELVAYLQGQLAQAQAQVVDLSVQIQNLKADNEKAAGVMAAFRAIAAASVDRLKVALGGTPCADTLSNDALLAEHASLRASFESKFKAGGVAAVSSAASAEKSESVDDPVRMARIKSTRLTK